MRKIFGVIVLGGVLFIGASVAQAGRPGFNIGLDLGYAKANYSREWTAEHLVSSTGTTVTSVRQVINTGFAGRAFLGYNFNKYFGMEAGYTYLPTVEMQDVTAGSTNGGTKTFLPKYADVVFRGMIPINKFDLFARAGIAWAYRSETSIVLDSTTYTMDSDQKFVPVVGVGIDYNINDYVMVNAFYTYYFKGGDSLHSTGFWGAGLAYKF
jgi:hypothetical protein